MLGHVPSLSRRISSSVSHTSSPGTVARSSAATVVFPDAPTPTTRSFTARLSASRAGRSHASRLDREQLLEARRILERPDQREVQPAPEDVLGDARHVLDGDGVERGEDLLLLDDLLLEHLAAQAEERQPVRALELEDEAALRVGARLLQLLARHRLVVALLPPVGVRPPRPRLPVVVAAPFGA